MAFSLLTAAIAPGLALLAYFYLKDRYDLEPISGVAKIFIIGTLTVFPTMVIQRGLVLGLGENPVLWAFGISAAIEEFVKWFVIFFLVYRNTTIRAPYDAIVYATAASLGFATMENILFSLLAQPSFSTLLIRALLPVSGHALFAVIMGYYLAKAKYFKEQEGKFILYSWLLPVFWHGAFDYILTSTQTYWLWIIVPFMSILWTRGLRKVNRANSLRYFNAASPDEVKMFSNGQ